MRAREAVVTRMHRRQLLKHEASVSVCGRAHVPPPEPPTPTLCSGIPFAFSRSLVSVFSEPLRLFHLSLPSDPLPAFFCVRV